MMANKENNGTNNRKMKLVLNITRLVALGSIIAIGVMIGVSKLPKSKPVEAVAIVTPKPATPTVAPTKAPTNTPVPTKTPIPTPSNTPEPTAVPTEEPVKPVVKQIRPVVNVPVQPPPPTDTPEPQPPPPTNTPVPPPPTKTPTPAGIQVEHDLR